MSEIDMSQQISVLEQRSSQINFPFYMSNFLGQGLLLLGGAVEKTNPSLAIFCYGAGSVSSLFSIGKFVEWAKLSYDTHILRRYASLQNHCTRQN